MTRRAEDGFTLLEVLMAGIIGSVIIGAVATTFIAGLRTHAETSSRLSETFDTQLLSTYLVPDVQSAGPNTTDLANALTEPAGGCSSGPAGTHVLTVRWRETVPVPSSTPVTAEYRSSYRLRDVGGERQLIRLHCVNGGTPSLHVLGRSLASGGASATIDPDRVTMRLTGLGGYSSTVTASRRSTVDTPPPPAGQPEPPCLVDYIEVTPTTAFRSPVGGVLLVQEGEPIVSVDVSGSDCRNMRVDYEQSTGGPPSTAAMSSTGERRTATLPSTGWDAGTFELRVSWAETPASVRNELATVDLTVETLEPCVVENLEVVPDRGERQSNPQPGVLAGAVLVRATTSPTCTVGLTLLYDPTTTNLPAGGAATTKQLSFSSASPTATQWTVEIPATERWVDGDHPLLVRQGTGILPPIAALASRVFRVDPRPCVVTAVTAEPFEVEVNRGNDTLKQSVLVTATVDGVCAGLQVTYTPKDSLVTAALTESDDGRTWSHVIAASGPASHKWSTGAKTITVLRNNTPVGQTTLQVR